MLFTCFSALIRLLPLHHSHPVFQEAARSGKSGERRLVFPLTVQRLLLENCATLQLLKQARRIS